MRGSQLVRQWKILRLIESRRRGITALDVRAHLDIPLRTVYRDLEAIQTAGFPIYNERVHGSSRWKLTDGSRTGIPLPFTITELLSLHMSSGLLQAFEGSIFEEGIESLLAKVKASLPPEAFRFLENVSGQVKLGFGPPKKYECSRQVIAELSQAAAKRKRVEIDYRAASTGKETSRVVDPYQVWGMNGAIYLIGFCHLRRAVRTFAMDRITSFRALGESFRYPRDFRVEDFLRSAFRVMTGDPETIKIRFSAPVARLVRERIWHPTQELRPQEDGSIELTLEVPINYEIVSWILGFGATAVVLEPESLKDRIRQELEASLNRYTDETVPRTKTPRMKKVQ